MEKIYKFILYSCKFLSIPVICLFIYSCDFEPPQAFEAPKWELPITIPLIDTEYSLLDMLGDNNALELNDDTTSFIIEIEREVIPEDGEGEVEISAQLFNIACADVEPVDGECDSVDLSSYDQAINIPTPPTINQSESVSIDVASLLGSSLSEETCLPLTEGSEIEQTITIPAADAIDLPDAITQVNYITVESGTISVSVSNSFPFKIGEIALDFIDVTANQTWVPIALSNVGAADSESEDLANKQLQYPISLSINTSFTVNPSPEYVSAADECNIDIDTSTFTGGFCPAPVGIMNQACCEALTPSDYSATAGADLSSYTAVWESAQCLFRSSGYLFQTDDALALDITFSLDSFESINADISYNQEILINESLDIQDGVSLIEAHLLDTEDPDTNKIILQIFNNLFTEIDFLMEFSNIYDSNNDNQTMQLNESIPNGAILDHTFALQNKTIGDPLQSGEELSGLDINIAISMNQTGVDIPFTNTAYSFSIENFSQKTLSFDELTVNLQDFGIDAIEMGQQPAGMDEYELPTLQFNLITYNEINAPIELDLILTGLNTDSDGNIEDSKEANVNLTIEYSGSPVHSPEGIDTTLISLQDTKMIITRPDGSEEEGDITDSSGNPVSLFDIFTYENIQVDGTPKLEGTGVLTPGAGLWMDLELKIIPLSFIFNNDDVSFQDPPIEFEGLDSKTKEYIDEGLVSAVFFTGIENKMPLKLDISTYISNSSYVPLCIDSINNWHIENESFTNDGTIVGQEQAGNISSGCSEKIYETFNLDINSDVISTQIISDTTFVEQDTLTNSTLYLTLPSKELFFGRMISMPINNADTLNCNDGTVINSSQNDISINLGDTEIKWMAKNPPLYIAQKFYIFSSETVQNNVSGYCDAENPYDGRLTLSPRDYLGFKSFLTLRMKTDVLSP